MMYVKPGQQVVTGLLMGDSGMLDTPHGAFLRCECYQPLGLRGAYRWRVASVGRWHPAGPIVQQEYPHGRLPPSLAVAWVFMMHEYDGHRTVWLATVLGVEPDVDGWNCPDCVIGMAPGAEWLDACLVTYAMTLDAQRDAGRRIDEIIG